MVVKGEYDSRTGNSKSLDLSVTDDGDVIATLIVHKPETHTYIRKEFKIGTMTKALDAFENGVTKATKLSYMYRDGGNNKIHLEAVLVGSVSDDELKKFNEKHLETWFYPAMLGLSDTTFVDEGYEANEDDVDCHEFGSLESTYEDPTTDLTVQEFMARFNDGSALSPF